MNPLTLACHHPAPSFEAVSCEGVTLSLRDYRFRKDLLLVLLHGPSCPHCVKIVEELASQRAEWEKWDTATLVLQTEEDAEWEAPFRLGTDPEGAVKRRYAGSSDADVVLALLDHRGRFMGGWSLTHPDPVDWHEVSETARWVAVQEPECGACEVLPGWE